MWKPKLFLFLGLLLFFSSFWLFLGRSLANLGWLILQTRETVRHLKAQEIQHNRSTQVSHQETAIHLIEDWLVWYEAPDSKRVLWIAQKIYPSIEREIELVDRYAEPLRVALNLQDRWLRIEEPFRVLVLFQNNMELRPTGGFMGSYLEMELVNGAIQTFLVEDIYSPDGQLEGYVDAPMPIQQYLYQTGGWKLRDSNWNPDGEQAAEAVSWFFKKGGVTEPDLMVFVTLDLAQDVLDILGPVELVDYQVQLSSQNLYQVIQTETEHEFFPGATNKRDVLGASSRAVLRRLMEASILEWKELFLTVDKHIQARDIFFWSPDPTLLAEMRRLGFTAGLEPLCVEIGRCVDPMTYLYIVEANLGINKANCCIERQVNITLEASSSLEDGLVTTLELQYVNTNPSTPQPPKLYGGGYLNYLRILTNNTMRCVSLVVLNQDLGCDAWNQEYLDPYQVWGVPVLIPGSDRGVVRTSFVQPIESLSDPISLFIQKQPGLRTNQYLLKVIPPEGMISVIDQVVNVNKKEFELTSPRSVMVQFIQQ